MNPANGTQELSVVMEADLKLLPRWPSDASVDIIDSGRRPQNVGTKARPTSYLWWPPALQAIKRPADAPRRVTGLTDLRQAVILQFLEEAVRGPYKYGPIGGPRWMAEIIARLCKRSYRTGKVHPYDIMRWIRGIANLRKALRKVCTAATAFRNPNLSAAAEAAPSTFASTPTVALRRVPAAKPKAAAAAKSKDAPVVKPKIVPVVKPKIVPVTSPKMAPAAKPKPAAAAEPKASAAAKPKIAPATKPKPAPAATPKSAAVAKPKIAPVAKPKSAPAAETKTAPTAKPRIVPAAKPKIAPATKPKPAPAATPKPAPAAKRARRIPSYDGLPVIDLEPRHSSQETEVVAPVAPPVVPANRSVAAPVAVNQPALQFQAPTTSDTRAIVPGSSGQNVVLPKITRENDGSFLFRIEPTSATTFYRLLRTTWRVEVEEDGTPPAVAMQGNSIKP